MLDAHYAPATLAQAFGIPLADLREANRALLSPVWEGQKYVPAGYALRVPRNPSRAPGETILASIDGSKRFGQQRRDRHYRVHRGDTLSKIARRFSVRESELVSLNGLRSKHKIRVGQLLRLPLGDEPTARTRVAREKRPSDGRYKVRRGDSLSAIAKRFGVSQSELTQLNGLRNRNTLHVGQVLKIPGPGVASAPKPTGPAFDYRVRRGSRRSPRLTESRCATSWR
jgi:membrane-bound lytic murein transglycosylase D